MADAIARYAGGINFLAQAAIREDGQIFMRLQEKGPDGCHVTFFVLDGTTNEQLVAAKRHAKSLWDVVSFSTKPIDQAIFDEAKAEIKEA